MFDYLGRLIGYHAALRCGSPVVTRRNFSGLAPDQSKQAAWNYWQQV